MKHLFAFLVIVFLLPGFTITDSKDLVKLNHWYIAGPVMENEEIINKIREKDGIIRVTTKDSPMGEIELNVMITPSGSNDGIATRLSEKSNFMTITYKSSQLIKLQAREGNQEGTGCIHGGSHPRVDIPASPDQFRTVKISWKDFKQDGLPNGKLLDVHNLCKFNFVNYNPVSGSFLEIKSVVVDL